MERLTERDEDWFALQKPFTHMGEVVVRLAAYEDAEERGECVRVVRCKDCKHAKSWSNADIKRTTYSCSLLGRTHLEHLYNSCRGFLGSADLSGNFFCAYGELKAEEVVNDDSD